MDIFLTQENIILATGIALVFTLGMLTHRLLIARRENTKIHALTDKIERLEQQRGSAHQVSLELAATHNKLVGEHLEAEWTIHSLRSDLKLRDARIEKLLNAPRPAPPVVKTDVWSLEETTHL